MKSIISLFYTYIVDTEFATKDFHHFKASERDYQYVSVHNRSFISARKPSYAQKNYLCGFSDS